MNPTLSLKFLRNGMDSANSLANSNFPGGQMTYNFFESSINTVLDPPADLDPEVLHNDPIASAVKPGSNFVASLGNSEFSQFNQYGEKIKDFNFPYSLRYEPNPDLSYEDTAEYTETMFERFSKIEPNTTLYTVWARDKPASLGGEEKAIALIITRSELRTSLWGDKHMYFRH